MPPGSVPLAGRPLDRARWPRDPSWREMLRVVVAGSRGEDLPAPARDALGRLERAGDADLEELARPLLSGAPRDLATAPFVGAALQVYFTRLAATLDAAAVPAAQGGCPVCGSPPVAGVVLGNERTRYLSCSLCATQWRVPRVQCAACGGTARIAYLALEDGGAGISAETCDDCMAYLKQLDLLQVPAAEPVADDAATLVLDLLVAERGYRRAGANLLAPAGEPAS
jgi:FdhE protein